MCSILLEFPLSHKEFIHAVLEFSGNNDIAFDPLLLYVVNIVSFFYFRANVMSNNILSSPMIYKTSRVMNFKPPRIQ